MTHRIHNFSAGPSALPLPVLERAQGELVDFRGEGMSIMEMSHRGKVVDAMHNETIANLRRLLDISDDHEVIFMGGGARSHFAILAMNFLGKDGFAEYVNTGSWATHALKQGKKIGDAREVWTSKESTFDHVPAAGEVTATSGASYFHYTSNNTIYGTQFAGTPDTGDVPLICDMSSDILSRPVDVSKYGMIYAGAQKNMGPAGVTVLIVKKDMLERASDELPEMFHYAKIAEKNSMLNTPPVFPIYMINLVTAYLLDQGGLTAMQKHNEEKSAMLYGAMEASGGYYSPHAKDGSRSHMNVTFRLPNEDLDKKFIAESAAANLSGLKGHRSVGGLRASIYNAVPKASVEALVEFMKEFKQANG